MIIYALIQLTKAACRYCNCHKGNGCATAVCMSAMALSYKFISNKKKGGHVLGPGACEGCCSTTNAGDVAAVVVVGLLLLLLL